MLADNKKRRGDVSISQQKEVRTTRLRESRKEGKRQRAADQYHMVRTCKMTILFFFISSSIDFSAEDFISNQIIPTSANHEVTAGVSTSQDLGRMQHKTADGKQLLGFHLHGHGSQQSVDRHVVTSVIQTNLQTRVPPSQEGTTLTVNQAADATCGDPIPTHAKRLSS